MPDEITDLADPRLARINELSAVARTNWFALLGYIAFAGVTLLGVEDADFFIDSRQTQLPLVNVGIPTRELFLFGPLLGAALFVYLHLYLLKLWDSFAAVPPTVQGDPLALHVRPWLVNDFALRLKGASAVRPVPFALVSCVTTFLLVFASGPLIVLAFWVRYWPAHQFGLSLLTGVVLAFVTLVAVVSLAAAWAGIRHGRSVLIAGWHALTSAAMLLAVGIVTDVTLARTGGPDAEGWGPLGGRDWPTAFRLPMARADLREVVFVDLPDDWLPYETHKRRFRIDWCAGEGLDPETCGPPPFSDIEAAPHLPAFRERWCREHDRYPDEADCDTYFAALDERFSLDWRIERQARIDGLDRWAPENLDLRFADLSLAVLHGAVLRSASLDHAKLRATQMEATDLVGAQMRGADLDGAQLQGAILRTARLDGASLERARLEGAGLAGARMSGEIFLLPIWKERTFIGHI